MEGVINGNRYQAPHCDELVLHAPYECTYCDAFPERQAERVKTNVNFTGHSDPGKSTCPAELRRPNSVINRWGGNVALTEEDVQKMADEFNEQMALLTNEFLDDLHADPPSDAELVGLDKLTQPTDKTCICVVGRSRFCPVHGEDDEG
jgi:hypothetical protein